MRSKQFQAPNQHAAASSGDVNLEIGNLRSGGRKSRADDRGDQWDLSRKSYFVARTCAA
jgi:hypothetical protein